MKIQTDSIISGVVIIAATVFVISIIYMMNTPLTLTNSYINYCTDTPEGKTVASRMNKRYDYTPRTEETALVALQDLDRLKIWAEANTTGDEKNAWICWCNYFQDDYSKVYKQLHADKTVKTPP